MKTILDNFGLKERDLKTIFEILDKYAEVKLVQIFGSRAKGTHKTGSDIDLAIMNDGVPDSTIMKIKSEFEDSSLPYFVDFVNFPQLKHPGLIEHIERVGKVFYEK
ncbi:nucleotidyltransferase domain-containing protein [Aquiflexum sp.]|uniref:nucleotidyltransferase domain-containing protein n=1 Tax=Aquiflexum sp. TaxID=1872584 RepID=UPI0035942084